MVITVTPEQIIIWQWIIITVLLCLIAVMAGVIASFYKPLNNKTRRV